MIGSGVISRTQDTQNFTGWYPCRRIPAYELSDYLIIGLAITEVSENLEGDE
jgi:hypothetical protein